MSGPFRIIKKPVKLKPEVNNSGLKCIQIDCVSEMDFLSSQPLHLDLGCGRFFKQTVDSLNCFLCTIDNKEINDNKTIKGASSIDQTWPEVISVSALLSGPLGKGMHA